MDINILKFIDTLESNVSFDDIDIDCESADSCEYNEFRSFEDQGELT